LLGTAAWTSGGGAVAAQTESDAASSPDEATDGDGQPPAEVAPGGSDEERGAAGAQGHAEGRGAGSDGATGPRTEGDEDGSTGPARRSSGNGSTGNEVEEGPSLPAPPAADAGEPSEQARETAREAYARGQRLYEEGAFRKAESAFIEAYAAVPNPVVLLGIAKAREAQNHSRRALAALERYLDERPDAPDREQVEERVAELRAAVGAPTTLRVTSTPPGASVRIDGEDTGKTTPAELELEPGEHAVTLRLEGYEDGSRTVRVREGESAELSLPLEESEPPGPETEPFGEGIGIQPPKADSEPSAAPSEEGAETGVWIATGVAGGALVAGTVLGFLALSEQSDFDAAPSEEAADDGQRFALFADVSFGLALGAGITAIVLHFTSTEASEDDTGSGESVAVKRDGPQVDVTPSVGRNGGGIGARVRF
jgi:hypothetical protein